MTGQTFVSWYDPTVECTPIWNGRDYLLAVEGSVSMPSSLGPGPTQQPAKAQGARGSGGTRACSLVAQTRR
jgi:hypothetical protein